MSPKSPDTQCNNSGKTHALGKKGDHKYGKPYVSALRYTSSIEYYHARKVDEKYDTWSHKLHAGYRLLR
jgi:hypothetical protein